MVERRAFVCGCPIAHSRSPMIHGYWLRQLGLDAASYDAIEVQPAEIDGFISSIVQRGFVGGNVTIPHKEAAYRGVEIRDREAEAIGAVNTIWIAEGKLHGTNTDAYGFRANLDQYAPDWHDAETAVVLGAGGASRAIVHALIGAGFRDIRLVNRTRERAAELARRFGASVKAHHWDDISGLLSGCGLLVNTTAVGMDGAGALDIDMCRLPARAVVTDIVYVPLETRLLADARKAGLRAVDGLGMLLHQAVPGFEKWFGVRPVVDEALRALVVADLEAAH